MVEYYFLPLLGYSKLPVPALLDSRFHGNDITVAKIYVTKQPILV